MALLSRDAILQIDDLPKKLVAVPEWGGDVYIRMLRGDERNRFEQWIAEGKKNEKDPADNLDVVAKLLICSVVNDSGERLFQESDLEAVKNKSAAALMKLYDVAAEINRLTRAAQEAVLKN